MTIRVSLRHVAFFVLAGLLCLVLHGQVVAEETRLLRQPTLGDDHVAFAYGGDLWIVDRAGGEARRLTSTPAVESDPHFSPDGRSIAFTSSRSGTAAVYVLPVAGGNPTRLTWFPAGSSARGWTPDGSRVLYASTRETAPVGYERLWTVSPEGGPSTRLPSPWGHRGSYAPEGGKIAIERIARWDTEWRHYRGGQNTPLTILDLADLSEIRLPNERTTDSHPVWMGGKVYFLSDREWTMNVWSYDVGSGALAQVTDFDDPDVKWLAGRDGTLILERDGYLHTLDLSDGQTRRLEITVRGDFPWAGPSWENVGDRVRWAEISPTGKRAVFEARGEVFTVPVEKGDTRNLTRSPGAADRAPVWSPKGTEIAWFSDSGDGYELLIAAQDGLSEPRRIPIGESKMAWETTWSPDGTRIAFVDDDVRVRVLTLDSGEIVTADVGGINIERGSMELTWSPDSKWIAYSKTYPNNLQRIVVWSVVSGEAVAVTDAMADAMAPSWSPDGKHLYFLASTDVALGSGWANTSRMGADPTYGVYVAVLSSEDPTPFEPESDEEEPEEEEEEEEGEDKDGDKKKKDKGDKTKKGKKAKDEKGKDGEEDEERKEPVVVKIDLDGIERRIVTLPMPVSRYRFTLTGPEGGVFVGERIPDTHGMTLHKFSLEDREAKPFLEEVSSVSVSADGKKLLYRSGEMWKVVGTEAPPSGEEKPLKVSLRMRLDRSEEWRQIFDEAWRYMRDFFYDPDMHGRDWDVVRERYAPLVPYVRHRNDLNYIIDQVSGEMSVGHSFVFGGDMPDVDRAGVGALGADLVADGDRWKIDRIYTFESWNPTMRAPLDRPGLKVEVGHYILAVDGVEMTTADDPYRLLDGTAGRQTVLHVNDKPTMEEAWTVTVEPIGYEGSLRQRAWVEDNRRRVDELSDGKLAYVWVPNTGQPGVISFNRYFFAQQDKLGAVIDERFNGGGLLDDYMVDLMTRDLRAAITNEVPGGRPFRLPAGILGPKVLLINELAGSGGDFFPWVFRQQKAGPLIGARTWGGLVKSSVHYPMIDGGALTAPDNAVFDPIEGRWIGENVGIPPDIEVIQDARSVADGGDPQLERGVEELLRMLTEEDSREIAPPPYSTPGKR
jgi:tricorn protease